MPRIGFNMANTDVGAIVFGVLAAGFMLLMILALRKVLNKGDSAKAIDAESSSPAIEDGLSEEESTDEIEQDDEPSLEAAKPQLEEHTETDAEETLESSQEAMNRGLEKTRKGFMSRLKGALFGGKAIDDDLIDELEEILVTSDLGIHTTQKLLEGVRNELSKAELADADLIQNHLKEKIREILGEKAPEFKHSDGPTVVMVIGVNGVGKTTTIGKVAARMNRGGSKLILAAGDTFRAAAVEQLGIWAERSNSKLVRGPDNSDPSAVMFEAVQAAQADKVDYCIADTAGRLHTKINLMEELKKVRRVMGKAMDGAPHETILVIDATTGQNGIAQAKKFSEAVPIDSIALTKLDGTAKGGVVVAICDALGIPVRYVGVGEGIDDLRDFDPDEFVNALFSNE
ncbi:MAG: signal recognition particle-docking protein FtsY [Myxococcota bacterium]|nr:signal recognition particle-docking protein FtsY [Myxococcota bacterium]